MRSSTRTYQLSSAGSGQQFVVKDVFTLSNTSTNQTATLEQQYDQGRRIRVRRAARLQGQATSSTATYRYDGSSLFGAGNRWAPFGRVSGVWRVSEESFWHVPHITDFRLRASHGTAGNTPRFNAQYETYNCSTTGCSLGQAGNRDLKPETTTRDRDGYGLHAVQPPRRRAHARPIPDTKNQILNVPTPSTLGFTKQWQNAGTLDNHTWEVAANLPVINRSVISAGT